MSEGKGKVAESSTSGLLMLQFHTVMLVMLILLLLLILLTLLLEGLGCSHFCSSLLASASTIINQSVRSFPRYNVSFGSPHDPAAVYVRISMCGDKSFFPPLFFIASSSRSSSSPSSLLIGFQQSRSSPCSDSILWFINYLIHSPKPYRKPTGEEKPATDRSEHFVCHA